MEEHLVSLPRFRHIGGEKGVLVYLEESDENDIEEQHSPRHARHASG